MSKTQARPQRTKSSAAEDPSPSRGLLDAAAVCLRERGYSGLSTRRVAELAGVPLSQIHYHFGSKQGLVLALLSDQNRRLLERQEAMFSEQIPLWQRWERACDYLDEDLASGYVRVLQEMTAAGWSNGEIAADIRRLLQGWFDLLARIAKEAAERLGPLGPFLPSEVACLVATTFFGSEAMLLLDFKPKQLPAREALRKFGGVLRQFETDRKRRGLAHARA